MFADWLFCKTLCLLSEKQLPLTAVRFFHIKKYLSMKGKANIYKREKNNDWSIKSWINMTEQPNEPNINSPQVSQIEKLLIDDPSNFQFHAAYLVYSETFDVSNEDVKKELNQNLEDLKENKIDAQTFYVNISRYRKLDQPMGRSGKFTVATQRKRDWRMKTQRSERIKRHKK
jgi:hypothetical protein